MKNEDYFYKNHWLAHMGLALSLALFVLFIVKDWDMILEWLRYVRDPELLEQIIREPGLSDYLLLLVMTLLMSAVPFISSSVISIVNGVVLGSGMGFVINWLGISLGNILVAYLMTRLGLGRRKQGKKSKHEEFLNHFDDPFVALCIGYMIPFIPSFLVNSRAVTLKLPKRQVAMAIMIGAVPASLIYALGGNAIFHLDMTELIAVVVALIVILAGYLGVRYIKLRKKEKTK